MLIKPRPFSFLPKSSQKVRGSENLQSLSGHSYSHPHVLPSSPPHGPTAWSCGNSGGMGTDSHEVSPPLAVLHVTVPGAHRGPDTQDIARTGGASDHLCIGSVNARLEVLMQLGPGLSCMVMRSHTDFSPWD
jgi:hypothetical protein